LFTKTPSERLVREPIVALDTAIVILDAAIATVEKRKKNPVLNKQLRKLSNGAQTQGTPPSAGERDTEREKELRLGFGYGFPSGRIYHINGWDCARK
jgi:hypothetical protein